MRCFSCSHSEPQLVFNCCLPLRKHRTVYSVCWWSFQFAEGKIEQSRMYTCGGRAAVTELSWSRLLEGMLQEREQSQREETYFTLLILSIVLNEGHSRPKAHLYIFSVPELCGGQQAVVRGLEAGGVRMFVFMCGEGFVSILRGSFNK